jgi:hypothetical protein
MAADFQTISVTVYGKSDGAVDFTSDAGPFILGGADTDDGEWNVGDASGDSFPGTTFQGSYDADGTTFLVFDGGTQIVVYSVAATTASAGYPANLADLPALTVTPLPVCFAEDTLISTPDGETAVEALEIGDLVMTADGRSVPVKWIGRQTILKLFAGDRARPVRVTAGALGDGVPHRDLVVTSDHALILDGLAITAGALVNGTTILLDPLAAVPDRCTYFHVETEGHEVILANGAPAETYVDYAQRSVFDNHAEYVALYGNEPTIAEMPLPRISARRLVPPALRARLDRQNAA